MRKLLLLLPLTILLAACQKETIDSKRICALLDVGALEVKEASEKLGLEDLIHLVRYCKHYID